MKEIIQGRARKRAQKWAAKNTKKRCKCEQSTKLDAYKLKIMCPTDSRKIEYEKGNSGTYSRRGFGNKKNFLKDATSNHNWK